MKRTSLLVLAAFLLLSCEKDDDGNSGNPTGPEPINLSNPEAGQENTYLRFTYNCGESPSFQYTGDTLKVQVKETIEGTVFREEFTPGSSELSGIDPVEYRVISQPGRILIPEREVSFLFFFYGNDTIHLNRDPSVELSQDDCYIDYPDGEPFIGEEIGNLNALSIHSILHTQSKVVSCVPFILNLDAYLLYNSRDLKMSYSIREDLGDLLTEGYTLKR